MSIQPGTQRIVALLAHLPPLTTPVVHIAGTNGKGSVSAVLDAVMTAAGIKTARFNSPHLVSAEDAIRLSGKPISRELYDATRAEVERVDGEHACEASLFELLTATALVVFARASVDVVLVECGMGGVDDATNVFGTDQVLASVLTAVDLDHQAFLGNTVGAIARAKAGIVKQGGVLVVGLQKHGEIRPVVEELANERQAEVVWAERSFVGSSGSSPDAASAADSGTQPVLTPLPISADRTFAGADVPDTLALLQSQLMHLMSATQPLLAENADETPASVLPSIQNIALLSTFIRGFSRAPQPVLRTDLPLPGEHQRNNLSLALAVVEVLRTRPAALERLPTLARLSDEVVALGVRQTVWDGRCSWLSVPLETTVSDSSSHDRTCCVLADGAHNPSSARLLASYLSTIPASAGPRPRTFILSLSHSPPKTPGEVLGPLLRTGDRVALVEFATPIEGMPWVRPVPIDELIEPARALVGDEAPIWAGSLADALEWARGEEKDQGLVVVAGSLYLVADLYRLLRKDRS